MAQIKIIFHPIAKDDLKDIYDYFSRSSLQYADSFLGGLYEQIEDLKRFPKMGKLYPKNPEYRQIIYQNYRVLYQYNVEEEKIIIMMFIHCSRQLHL